MDDSMPPAPKILSQANFKPRAHEVEGTGDVRFEFWHYFETAGSYDVDIDVSIGEESIVGHSESSASFETGSISNFEHMEFEVHFTDSHEGEELTSITGKAAFFEPRFMTFPLTLKGET